MISPEEIAKMISEDPDFASPIPVGPRKFIPAERSQEALISDIRRALSSAIRFKKSPDTDDPEINLKMDEVIQALVSALGTLGAPIPPRKRPTGELAF